MIILKNFLAIILTVIIIKKLLPKQPKLFYGISRNYQLC
jgi:hypothetical protein